MHASDCKIALIHTDDSGRTWSQPQVITQPGRNYTLTYTDGIVTSVADGNGPNVDYVITYGMQNNNDGGFAVSGLYSTDAGRTWTPSSSIVELDATAFEGGVSETAIVELKDHRLYMLMRCQFASVVNFYQSYSNDYGKTWQSPPTPSVINAPNTMPVLERYQEKLLLLWAGNNTLGGSSYRRTPVTLAYSDNEALSWKQNLDVTYGTSWSSYDDSFNRATQPDITFPGYQNSKDAYLGWWNIRTNHNWGILIEDFDDYLFKTQGAYDSFEGPNLKNEGWLSVVGGTVTLSGDRATDGSKSMLLTDGASSIVRATRNLPSMTKGSISYDAYVPSGNNATFYTELKSSYNTAHRDHAPIVFCVTPDGDVHKDPGSEVVGHITLDQWHNFQVNFNLESMTAQLLVDGMVMCSNLPVVEGRGSFISCVQLSDASSFNAAGSKLYVDQVRATISNKTAGTVTVVG